VCACAKQRSAPGEPLSLEYFRRQNHDIRVAQERLEVLRLADIEEFIGLQDSEPDSCSRDGGDDSEHTHSLRDKECLGLSLQRVDGGDEALELYEFPRVDQGTALHRFVRSRELPQSAVLGAVECLQEFRVNFHLVKKAKMRKAYPVL